MFTSVNIDELSSQIPIFRQKDKNIIASMLQITQNIKLARVSTGMSQQEFADKLEVKRSTYAEWERNIEPKGTVLTKISELTGWSVDELINGRKNGKTDFHTERLGKKNGEQAPKAIPIYEDAPFTLTNTVSYRDVKTMEPDFWVTIPGLRNCNYGCRATGDSMHPLIRNQALVVGEEITDPSFILYGEIYIVQTRNNIETVKYIQAHDTDKSMLVLVPFNPSATKTPIKKKDILKLYRAKAVFNVL